MEGWWSEPLNHHKDSVRDSCAMSHGDARQDLDTWALKCGFLCPETSCQTENVGGPSVSLSLPGMFVCERVCVLTPRALSKKPDGRHQNKQNYIDTYRSNM